MTGTIALMARVPQNDNGLENARSALRLCAQKSGAAVLATCIVHSLDEQHAGFQERFLEYLENAHYRRKNEADVRAIELELYTWVKTLLTGKSWGEGNGKPFFSD